MSDSFLKIEVDVSDLEKMPDDINEFVQKLAFQIEAEAKLLIQHSTPTGRTYRRGAITKAASKRLLQAGFRRRGKTRVVVGAKFHRASAPGQPPATDEGNLVNSIQAQPLGFAEAEVNINAGYAAFLDVGTSRMATRPYVDRSIDLALERVMTSL